MGTMQVGDNRTEKLCIKRNRYIYCLLKQRLRLNCSMYLEVIYKEKKKVKFSTLLYI